MKITSQSKSYILFILLLLGNFSSAQNYNFKLVDNGNYSYTVAAEALFDSGSFQPNVQSYGFVLVVPDGVTITVNQLFPSGMGLTANSPVLIDGSNANIVGIDPTMANKDLFQITASSGGSTMSAHTNGAVIPQVTLTVSGSPTSGEIRLLDNSSTLASSAIINGTLDAFFTVDITNDGISNFNDEFNALGSTPVINFAYSYNNGWSPSDPIGVSTASHNINVVGGNMTISSNTACNNISIKAGAGITINNGVTLTTASGMVLESTSTSYSSLVLNGTITGTVTYQRHVNSAATSGQSTGSNDLISPPLSGQTFGAFRAANPNILSGTIGGNPAFLFGTFNNTSGAYETFSASDDLTILSSGMGYRTGSTDNSTFSFTGTPQNSNVNVAVDHTTTSSWYLIGNPYPSYLKVRDFLNESVNATLIDENAIGIYGYNGSSASNKWTIYNLATTNNSTVIAPGQGFFILVEGTGNIRFTPAMRTMGTTDDFITGRTTDNSLNHMELHLQSTSEDRTTDFYFGEDASLGLDPGYDAAVFGHTDHSFALYSRLVDNDEGVDLAIQTLPLDMLSNGTVSLGIHANQGEQLTLSLSDSNLPEGTEVYLFDSQENESTHLNTEDFIITPIEDLNGTGRFYINFSQQVLGLSENDLSVLQVFTLNDIDTLIIRGTINDDTKAILYDINGRLVLSEVLDSNSNSNAISTAELATGIYMVQLTNAHGKHIEKVIIN